MLAESGPQVSQIDNADIVCDAGVAARLGWGVRCQIERHTIMGNRGAEPRTLLAYCLHEPGRCPTWQAFKDAERARRGKRMQAELEADAREAERGGG